MRFTCKLPDHLEMDAPFETEIYILDVRSKLSIKNRIWYPH